MSLWWRFLEVHVGCSFNIECAVSLVWWHCLCWPILAGLELLHYNDYLTARAVVARARSVHIIMSMSWLGLSWLGLSWLGLGALTL